MNVNQIPILRNAGPPKKPQRNSIGILLDQIYDDEGSQVEFHTDVHQQPENRLPLPGSGPTHLEVKGPQYSLSNTLSSQDSDSPPPLPDRNYYDVDQAGEYTQLRRDAPPPKPQKHRETDYSPPQPDYDAMNEGPGNTSTDASEEGRGSIYEVLSTAKSGSPIHGSDYPAPPHHVSIQLHINEPEDDLSLTDVNTTCEGEYNLDHEDDQDLDAYELLSEAMTGGSPSKGRPKPKPRITPTSSSASSVPSTESASPLHKPVPLPRRGKPVPAKRSPGSISSQPSTPSEELTSSTASEHWEGRGGGALERPGTPDQPPPSPNTAMMGIHAKLSASELHYSDYDNPLDLVPCPCDVLDSSTSSSVFFPPDCPQEESVVANGGKQPSSGQLRKLELDLANRSRKFHEFEAAADQLQTRLEKWQARVEESHLSRPYEQSDRESGSIYENVHKSHYEESHQRRSLDNATVLTAANGNHPRALTRQNSSPVQSRSGSPRKPKRSLNSQLNLNITPPGINSPVQFQPKPVLPPKASHHQTTNDTSTSPNGYDNPAAVTGTHFPFENDNPEIRSSNGRQSVKEPALPRGLRSEESGALDNKLVEGNSEEEILKPDASHPFAGLIYGSNRGSRSFSLSQQDRFSALHPGRERAGAFSVRMSSMNGTMTDGPAKGDDQGVGIDESSEWEQIESIMNSFGAGLVRESVYERDFQRDFEKMFESPGRPQTVGEWLDSLNLGQYENMLIANGFDHLDFIGGDIIEEQDLMDIGIVEEIHRRMILEATRCLPIMKPIGIGAEFTPKPASVSDWLRSLLLSDYIPNFLENNISTMERALELWDFELENVLEIPMLGHRKRILASLGDRCRSRHSSTVEIELCPRPHSLDVDVTGSDSLELQIKSFVGPEEREEIERHTKPSSSLDIDLYKDYSKEVTSPTRNSTSSTVPEEGSLHPSEDEEFRELISSTEQYARQNGGCLSPKATQRERGMRTSESSEEGGQTERTSNGRPKHSRGNKQSEPNGPQWMHPPDALIRGCCNYTSSYLGSSIIKELHGTESTREACTRLRRSAQQVQKMPAITLSINYAGVKFIDSKSKMVITEHEICNISCVAQDSDDLKTFAYITKDSKHEKLYCHVFTVKTVELATEIILTLGQAFEIAYKMLLKTSHGHHSNGKASSAHESVDEPIMEDTRL
ncbi:uncharacterized protein [Diadema antillarum]|uniref:uncharacterized protein n=2 Tax=Diadema antillarum TaxID=105358 RepID=UPI003A838655